MTTLSRIAQMQIPQFNQVPIIAKIFIVFFLSSLVHYTMAHIYVYFCAPKGFGGFLQSMFLTESIHCRAIRSAMNYSLESLGLVFVFTSAAVVATVEVVKNTLK